MGWVLVAFGCGNDTSVRRPDSTEPPSSGSREAREQFAEGGAGPRRSWDGEHKRARGGASQGGSRAQAEGCDGQASG